jgi:anti-sigma factor RsiW
MKKLSTDDMMHFVDGTLEPARQSEVDLYLQQNPEEAELLADMKMALGALHEWNEAEPVQVSEDFWPKLRDKLPERAGSGWLRNISHSLGEVLWPRRSPWQLSARAAAVAVLVALGISFFSPKGATPNAQAALSSAERQFIEQSLVQHRAYAAVQPMISHQFLWAMAATRTATMVARTTTPKLTRLKLFGRRAQ